MFHECVGIISFPVITVIQPGIEVEQLVKTLSDTKDISLNRISSCDVKGFFCVGDRVNIVMLNIGQ